MRGAEILPFKPIGGIAVEVALTDGIGAKAFTPMLIMALRAGEIELSAPREEIGFTVLKMRAGSAVNRNRRRHAFRLVRNIGGE